MSELSAGARLLLIGYGNPGRRNDGLGPAFAAEVERLGLAGVSVDSNYQLVVEDAEAVARHPLLVLADAAADGPEPFSFQRLEPELHYEFTTHSLSPGSLLALAGEAFGRAPAGWLLGIRGYEFDEFGEGLSAKARRNLEAALVFFSGWMRDNAPETAAPRSAVFEGRKEES